MKIRWRGPQYAATKDLHHYIENNTELGRIMHAGDPTPQQYIGWLSFKARFFDIVDPHIPPASRRGDRYRADIFAMGAQPVVLKGSEKHVTWVNAEGLTDGERERRMTGTAYVSVGSVFGSLEIRNRMLSNGLNYPMTSLTFVDRSTELAFLNQLRNRADCSEQSFITFAAMVECCNEIVDAP